jgi:hypothetical protein
METRTTSLRLNIRSKWFTIQEVNSYPHQCPSRSHVILYPARTKYFYGAVLIHKQCVMVKRYEVYTSHKLAVLICFL